jgi:hypothetical protein
MKPARLRRSDPTLGAGIEPKKRENMLDWGSQSLILYFFRRTTGCGVMSALGHGSGYGFGPA